MANDRSVNQNSPQSMATDPPREAPGRLGRLMWMGVGGVACGLGFAGIVLPGLPATVFFILAAVCFSKSSPRLLAWVLSLPKVGPLVRDYRSGLGMPRAAKGSALLVLAIAGGSSLFVLPSLWLRVLLVVLLAVGVGVIVWGVPTRERILAERALSSRANPCRGNHGDTENTEF